MVFGKRLADEKNAEIFSVLRISPQSFVVNPHENVLSAIREG